MHKQEVHILETLAGNLDANPTIRALNQIMTTGEKKVHYPQTYNQVREMERKGILKLSKSGASKLVGIHFDSAHALTALTEMEAVRTEHLYRQHREYDRIHEKLEKFFMELPCLVAAAATMDRRLSALNKMELSFLIRATTDEKGENAEEKSENARDRIAEQIRKLESETNIRIHFLSLTETEFVEALFSREYNPVKELFRKQVWIYHPDHVWRIIQGAFRANKRIPPESIPKRAPTLKRDDIVLAFERYGYREIGLGTAIGKKVGLETAMAAALDIGDSRLLEAMAVIMAKDSNHQINYAILEYLADKQGRLPVLAGIIKTARESSASLRQNAKAGSCLKRIGKKINRLETNHDTPRFGIKKEQMREKLKTYHAD